MVYESLSTTIPPNLNLTISLRWLSGFSPNPNDGPQASSSKIQAGSDAPRPSRPSHDAALPGVATRVPSSEILLDLSQPPDTKSTRFSLTHHEDHSDFLSPPKNRLGCPSQLHVRWSVFFFWSPLKCAGWEERLLACLAQLRKLEQEHGEEDLQATSWASFVCCLV